MKLVFLCLGVLSLVYEGECVLTWSTPATVPSGGGDAGIVGALQQESNTATTLYTFALTAVTSLTFTQTPASIFAAPTVATNAAPLKLDTSQVVDYSASTTHVLVVTASDGTDTETATVTFVVTPVKFMEPLRCVDVQTGYYAAASTLATVAATGAQATTLLRTDTTAGYTFDAAAGTIKNDAIITTATQGASVTIVVTGSESFGTATTATSSVNLCINGGCNCPLSGASAITAGFLSIIMVLMLKLK